MMDIISELNKNSVFSSLYNKIESKEATVGVIGLGYVGLPLAVEIANSGYKVVGFDVDINKVDSVNKGESYINDVSEGELSKVVQSQLIEATNQKSKLEGIDAVIICVPTPLDTHHQPDITYVQNATELVRDVMHQGLLVILESTTYPNTTLELMLPILEESSLNVGEDFYLVYSPERVDPGNQNFKTNNIPKVVGGVTKDCTKLATKLYENVLNSDIHQVNSPTVAEMSKILENTFRNINIGLANEMAIICEKMGINVWEVIDAASTKPFGFMPFYPGPGLGGHCIPIDPFYLTWKAKEYKYNVKMVESASEINNYMPDFVVNKAMKLLNKDSKSLNGATIYLVGAAYKKDISDIRESPIFDIIKKLQENGAIVKFYDPYVNQFELEGEPLISTQLTKESIIDSDISIIITDHSNVDYELINTYSKKILDTRNIMTKLGVNINENYFRL